MSETTITPSSVTFKEVDLIKAKAILTTNDQYTVRYLRDEPTVGLANIPARNAADGAILPDVDPIRRRVICAGVPYGCMIAFMHDSKLLVGWSKRMMERQFVETHELHVLFSTITDKTATLTDSMEEYQNSFNMFCGMLSNLLTFQQPKEIEVAFSKVSGKTAAIIRGLNDTIAFTNGSEAISACSGPIPHDVTKSLRWFISQAEIVYGGKAANVSYANQAVAIKDSGSSLPAVA
jgi:hypothetical protein